MNIDDLPMPYVDEGRDLLLVHALRVAQCTGCTFEFSPARDCPKDDTGKHMICNARTMFIVPEKLSEYNVERMETRMEGKTE